MAEAALILNGQALRFQEVEAVARKARPVRIGEEARRRMEIARAVVQELTDGGKKGGGPAVYGVNTGFGSLSRVQIPIDQVREVQRNLVRSHAAGVGEPLPDEIVRAMLLILAASLCRGCSGVRAELAQLIVELLNKAVTPVVPSRGSVGASGDLAPLAHAALALIGEGEARINGRMVAGAEALKSAGLKPITLEAKEGLALINGTHLMCAIGSLAMFDVAHLQNAALAAAAMS